MQWPLVQALAKIHRALVRWLLVLVRDKLSKARMQLPLAVLRAPETKARMQSQLAIMQAKQTKVQALLLLMQVVGLLAQLVVGFMLRQLERRRIQLISWCII